MESTVAQGSSVLERRSAN